MIKLTDETVELVRRMEAIGMSQREIANEMGFSRGTVVGILHGRRTADQRPRCTGKSEAEQYRGIRPPTPSQPRNYWCSVCRTRVAFPCYLCGIRAQKRADKLAGRKPRFYDGQFARELNTPLAELNLSLRVVNDLETAGFILVGDLQGVDRDTIVARAQLGAGGLRSLVAAIKRLTE